MDITVVGTGFIGGILGRALAASGHHVTFGSRHPDDDGVAGGSGASVATIADALEGDGPVILALPGAAVPELVSGHGAALEGRLVIDATNRIGEAVPNCRAGLPATVRYARAFNTLGGENFEHPVFADGPADLFFSAPVADRETVEEIIRGVGLRPVFVGEDEEAQVDALFKLWVTLAMKQGHGRRLALRLISS